METPVLNTRWLATLRGTISEPKPIGGNMLVFNVDEAELEGPKISAVVVPPSGDWLRVMANGNWKLDVRLMLETTDGAHILCTYTGTLKADTGLSERIANGESVPGTDMYFRSTPYFETSDSRYEWLNDIVCVGTMRQFGAGEAVYDIFEVL